MLLVSVSSDFSTLQCIILAIQFLLYYFLQYKWYAYGVVLVDDLHKFTEGTVDALQGV